jgi:drug/metabolite transporter (DMT)-like permease
MAPGLVGFVREPRLLLGMACYLAVMALTTAAFKRGGSVATLYPVYALTFPWVAPWGRLARGEALRPAQLAGLALLVLGISLAQSGR